MVSDAPFIQPFDTRPAHISKEPTVSADAAPFLPTAKRVESVQGEFHPPYNPQTQTANPTHSLLEEVQGVPSDPNLPADVPYGPGPMQPQDEEQGNVLDMWLQGKQFVEHASATGIISDPAELARTFMRPRPTLDEQYTYRMMPHKVVEQCCADQPPGQAVLRELDKLVNNPSCTLQELAFVRDGVNYMIEQAQQRLQRSQSDQAAQHNRCEQSPILRSQHPGAAGSFMVVRFRTRQNRAAEAMHIFVSQRLHGRSK